MLPPFYDESPHGDPNWFLDRIRKEFPLRIREYRYLSWAFDHDVFIVNNKFVFRFPRTRRYLDHLQHEIKLLKFLDKKVQVRIPDYFYVSEKGDFAGYKILPGKILTTTLFKRLRKANKEEVVFQLTEFVNRIHTLSLNDFSKFMPRKREDFIADEKKIEAELKHRLLPRLSERDAETINRFLNESEKYLISIPNTCPTHGDLYASNVLWDDAEKKIGVIDFSDALIGDPAKDFEVFFDYGEEYAEIAYNLYAGPKDRDFLVRAKNVLADPRNLHSS